MIIDTHYETKHADVSDPLILELVQKLDGKEFAPELIRDGFQFYMLDRIPHGEKHYRLVLCMQNECLYIGVINAFRR